MPEVSNDILANETVGVTNGNEIENPIELGGIKT